MSGILGREESGLGRAPNCLQDAVPAGSETSSCRAGAGPRCGGPISPRHPGSARSEEPGQLPPPARATQRAALAGAETWAHSQEVPNKVAGDEPDSLRLGAPRGGAVPEGPPLLQQHQGALAPGKGLWGRTAAPPASRAARPRPRPSETRPWGPETVTPDRCCVTGRAQLCPLSWTRASSP